MSPHTCAGSLSLKELENMLLDDQSNPCTKEQCRELFESFDDDDNGEISLDEFKTGIKMFLGIQNEKMQAGGCARETLHLEKPRGVSKEPPSPSDIVLVYTQRGEHMVPKLAEALDAKRQQVCTCSQTHASPAHDNPRRASPKLPSGRCTCCPRAGTTARASRSWRRRVYRSRAQTLDEQITP